MLITQKEPKPRARHPLLTIRGIVTLALLLGTWGFVVALVVTRLNPSQRWWSWARYHGQVIGLDNGSLREWGPRLPGLWLSSLVNEVDVPNLAIDIKFTHMQQLRSKRDSALALGILVQGEDDYVPATIRLPDRSVRVKLRLKGDVAEKYLGGDRWGFRVQVKGDDQIFGMRRFSLHHPVARFYHGPVVFNEMARSEGILTPRYFFVDVVLNGDRLGRYALEEHFSKELLENRGRREGVILRYDESLLWSARVVRRDIGGEFYNFAHAKVKPFRASRIERSPAMEQDLDIAMGLARAFAEDAVPASVVFDPETTGRFLAISEAWGASHGLEWRNMRFYFNPSTGHLEPIAYDSGLNNITPASYMFNKYDPFLAKLLADSAIKTVYLKALARVARVLRDSTSRRYLEEVQEKSLKTLRSQYPLVTPFSLEALAQRAETMLAYRTGVEDPTGTDATHLLHAFRIATDSGEQLELASMDTNVVVVDSIFWTNDGEVQPFLANPPAAARTPLRIPGTPRWGAPPLTTIRYLPPPDSAWQLNMIAGQPGKRRYRVAAEYYVEMVTKSPVPSATLETVLARTPFTRWDDEHHAIRLLPGVWRRDTPLVFPEGVAIIAGPGTTIRFGPDAFLLARGPMEFQGTPGRPVRFEGLDGGTWPGIAAMPSSAKSTWSYVKVDRASGIDRPGWRLTGGVTFYRHPVSLTHVTFQNNTAEDAINLVHSTFTMREVAVANASSDGVDADFSDGVISNATFRHIGWGGGGDAVDISGAHVTVDSSSFSDIDDKALSAGEGSTMEVRAVTIDDAGAGAVAKDRSVLTLTGAHLTGMRHAGLMAYVKKPEYGPARLEATRVTQEGAARETWVQDGSEIVLDGVPVPTEAVNVDSLYQTIMKKASR